LGHNVARAQQRSGPCFWVKGNFVEKKKRLAAGAGRQALDHLQTFFLRKFQSFSKKFRSLGAPSSLIKRHFKPEFEKMWNHPGHFEKNIFSF